MKIQDQITLILTSNPGLSSREIHERLSSGSSYSTTKRALTELVNKKLVDRSGNKRSSTYNVGRSYQIQFEFAVNTYF